MTSSPETFRALLLAGKADIDDIHAHVDRWHAGAGDGLALSEYLGLSEAEYEVWLYSPWLLESRLRRGTS